jgi:hypothetical protein
MKPHTSPTPGTPKIAIREDRTMMGIYLRTTEDSQDMDVNVNEPA